MASNKVDLLNWLACIPSRICRIGLTVNKTFKEIARHHTGYQRSIFVHNLIYRKNPAVEAALRQFMTIGDYRLVFFLFIYIAVPKVSISQSSSWTERWACDKRVFIFSNYFLPAMTQRTNHDASDYASTPYIGISLSPDTPSPSISPPKP